MHICTHTYIYTHVCVYIYIHKQLQGFLYLLKVRWKMKTTLEIIVEAFISFATSTILFCMYTHTHYTYIYLQRTP